MVILRTHGNIIDMMSEAARMKDEGKKIDVAFSLAKIIELLQYLTRQGIAFTSITEQTHSNMESIC